MVSDFPIEDGLMLILAKMVVNERNVEANIKGRLHLQRHDTPWWKCFDEKSRGKFLYEYLALNLRA